METENTQESKTYDLDGMQSIVNDTVVAMVSSGAIKQRIEQGIEKSINEAIDKQFEHRGGITKQLDEAMEKGLQLNIKDLPFETYNQQILVAVKSRMATLFQGAASERFMAEMDKMLAPAPETMAVNDLVNHITSFWKSDDPCNCDDSDEYATVEVERKYSGWSVEMWKQLESGYSTKRKNTADVSLFLLAKNKDENEFQIRLNHRQAYNPTCFTEHEALVFKLYAAGTVITGLDEFESCECELALRSEEY